MKSKTAVIAIGGHALSNSDHAKTFSDEFANTARTGRAIAELIRDGWSVVMTHGNGPQVGHLLTVMEKANEGGATHALPLFMCSAQTQGSIGLMLQQALGNALHNLGIARPVISMITQVRVDPDDPGLLIPSKPVGPHFDAAQAQRLKQERGWIMQQRNNGQWRRVVPSPIPKEIIERDAILAMLAANCVPIAVGGGGIPVIQTAEGLHGVDAVIDKDRSSALLAHQLDTELLVICTAVPYVMIDFQRPTERIITRTSPEALKQWAHEGQFEPGSMGPKIEAVLQFVDRPGRRAVICDDFHLLDASRGTAGTQIHLAST